MKYENKKLIAFDLDGTLTESRTPMDAEMKILFSKLVSKYKVGVISGGLLSQFQKQLLFPLGESKNLSNLVILPGNGTSFYIFKDDVWKTLYEEELTAEEKNKITLACIEVVKETGYEKLFKEKGGIIQDKKGQMSLAIYYPDWDLSEKMVWDPERTKREPIRKLLQEKLPDYEVKIGGTTTIDVTPKGIDKAYAMEKILEYFDLKKQDAIFAGDAIFPGGNDYAASQVVEGINVKTPEDTKRLIESLL